MMATEDFSKKTIDALEGECLTWIEYWVCQEFYLRYCSEDGGARFWVELFLVRGNCSTQTSMWRCLAPQKFSSELGR
jgi:hypothetical protein